MTTKSRERYWDLQSETLRKIRADLDSNNNNRSSIPETPGGRYSISPRRRGSHPLPRLDTPPDLSRGGRGSNLRESRYHVVPPVRRPAPRNKYESPDDDSWGEEEDNEEEEVPYPQVMPVPYPMMVYPGAPVAWPVVPSQGRKKRGKKVRYADRPTFIAHQYDTDPRYNDDLQYIVPDESVLRRYQVFPQERHTSREDSQSPPTAPTNPLGQAAVRFDKDPSFCRRLVEDLIWEDMEEDLIPSVLVDVLRENEGEMDDRGGSDMGKDHPMYWPAFDVTVDLVDREVPRLVREIVSDVTGETARSHFEEFVESGDMDPILDELDSILDEVVHESAEQVAREGVRELAQNHLKVSAILGIIEDMCDEVIDEDAQRVADSAVKEVTTEDMLDNDVINPVVMEVARQVAMETLQYYGNKFRRKETKAVEQHASNKLVEHICLEYLLNFIARQSQLYSPEEAAEKFLDGMMLNILLEQYNAVQTSRSSTIENRALKKHHEKLFTDAGAEVLLEELCKSLDEDMEDLDEYEQGLWDPASSQPPEWAINDIK